MRNEHEFKEQMVIKCKEEGCGKHSYYTVVVRYVTNQRGDVIEHSVDIY